MEKVIATEQNQKFLEKMDEKVIVHTGIVTDIKKLNSKFGHTWRIELNYGPVYYLNAKSPDLADKLFKDEEKTAFTCKKKDYKDRVLFIIDQVLYTF